MKREKAFFKSRARSLCGCILFLERIEGDGDLPCIRTQFLRIERSVGWDSLLMQNRLRIQLERNDYRALDTVFLLSAAFVLQSSRHE